MSNDLARAVDRLSRIPGVRGALVADAAAGVPVVESVADGVAGPAVVALAASLYRCAAAASENAGLGAMGPVQVDAGAGYVIIIGAGDLLLVIVAEKGAQLGLLLLEAQRVAEALP